MGRPRSENVNPDNETPEQKKRRMNREAARRAYLANPQKFRAKSLAYRLAHPEKTRDRLAQFHKDNPTYNRDYGRIRSARNMFKGKCVTCGQRPATVTRQCDECRESAKRRMAAIKLRQRRAALALYGGKCACCGEAEERFLAFDHINNDGAKQRRENKRLTSSSFVRYLLTKRPTDIQVLCHNCNSAKGYYGICPHEEKRQCQQLQTPEILPEQNGTKEYLQ